MMTVSLSSMLKVFSSFTFTSVSFTLFTTSSTPMRTLKHMPAFTVSGLPALMRSDDSRNSRPMPVPHSFEKCGTKYGAFSFSSATARS